MRALVIDDGRVSVADRDVPVPRRGEALVRVSRAGICGTDLELLAGYKGFRGVPGHEFVGVVERADAAPEWLGRRVVASINAGCGSCATCRVAGEGHCPDRRVMGLRDWDGALAEVVAVPVANLHGVADALPDERAVFAEPLAAACRVAEQVEVAGRRVAVVGAGRLGLLIALALRIESARVTALARSDRAATILADGGIDVVRGADELAEAERFDVVVDATGAHDGLALARSLVRPRGVLVLKSTCAGDPGAALDPTALVVDEVTVVGSRCGPIPRALQLLESGAVPPDGWIDGVFPLERGREAFAAAEERGALKILIAPGS